MADEEELDARGRAGDRRRRRGQGAALGAVRRCSPCSRVVAALTLPPGAPLRNPETGDIIGDSPLMSSLIVIISAASSSPPGSRSGAATGTVKGSEDALGDDHEGVGEPGEPAVPVPADRAVHRLLRLQQHRAGRRRSRSATSSRTLDLGDLWLLLGIIIVTLLVDFIIPAKIAKWAILAPIFIPLMLRLGVEPQTVLAAYRVGDSPINVLTPLMPYFPLMVVFAQRYQRDAGIGTVIALMIPYALIVAVVWIAVLHRCGT